MALILQGDEEVDQAKKLIDQHYSVLLQQIIEKIDL